MTVVRHRLGSAWVIFALLLVFCPGLLVGAQQSPAVTNPTSRPRRAPDSMAPVAPASSTAPTAKDRDTVSHQDEQDKDTLQLGVTNIVLPVTVIIQKDLFVPT